jgi:hypothetical protein
MTIVNNFIGSFWELDKEIYNADCNHLELNVLGDIYYKLHNKVEQTKICSITHVFLVSAVCGLFFCDLTIYILLSCVHWGLNLAMLIVFSFLF